MQKVIWIYRIPEIFQVEKVFQANQIFVMQEQPPSLTAKKNI